MDVHGLQLQTEVGMAEQMEQRHRVRPAGEGHQHPLADQLGKGRQKVQGKLGKNHALS